MDHHFDERRSGVRKNIGPYITEFEIDKGRIIHAESFRRLQSKTQVFQVSESDFHRNRLTHSIEVAQIGRGISRFIEHKYKSELKNNKIVLYHDLIEAICLAHDIGHAPFGHGGEVALNYMMRDHGGFEANAQTLRIVSKLGKYSKAYGMDLTRRATLGILKYPCSYSEIWDTSKKREIVTDYHELNQKEWKPAKCYFDDEQEVVNWVLRRFTQTDKERFQSFYVDTDGDRKAQFKSFDCTIMELADDISYAMHDFEDGLELKKLEDLTVKNLVETLLDDTEFENYLKNLKDYEPQIITKIKSLEDPKWFISLCVGFLISNVEMEKNEINFDSPYLQYKIVLNYKAQKILNEFKKIVWDNIIKSPNTQLMVKSGQLIVCSLFDAILNDNSLLPKDTKEKLVTAEDPYRIICDYIAGMTDRYAFKMYYKHFGGELGSHFWM